MSGNDVTCPLCAEVQDDRSIRCARCGHSLETDGQRRSRLAAIEQARREAEREDVSIERLPGFGFNGTPRARFGTIGFFEGMSNQLRRRYVFMLAIVVVLVIVIAL